ncbi:MAG: hypothetical protein V4541_04580 [Bacteroidota bacterium]
MELFKNRTFQGAAVRRKITGVRLELTACGIKGHTCVQPFSLYAVLFTKPASKGLQENKNYKQQKNNYLK